MRSKVRAQPLNLDQGPALIAGAGSAIEHQRCCAMSTARDRRDGMRAERIGTTQTRTEIVWVSHTIKNQYQSRLIYRRQNLLKTACFRNCIDQSNDALVPAACCHIVQTVTRP